MPLPDAVLKTIPDLSDSGLKCLTSLFRLGFRYDPDSDGGGWVCPDRTFSRAEVQAECGLSGQGTRNGLSELEEEGYVSTDRSGRSHRHKLEIDVPEKRFTYVPTDLLEKASSLSGTELRLVFAVLRATWGWTTGPSAAAGSAETDGNAPEHRRWAQLSTSTLKKMTGLSKTAIKKAARGLEERYLHRCRPTSGAYYYRFRVEALLPGVAPKEDGDAANRLTLQKKVGAFFSMGVPNDLTPDRQRSAPPRRGNIESFFERPAKQYARNKRFGPSRGKSNSSDETSAVSGHKPRHRRSTELAAKGPRAGETRPKRSSHRGQGGEAASHDENTDLTGLSDRKQELGQKLANVGVWPHRIPELLTRYSADRIEANFQYYRSQAATVDNPGGYLAKAIREGYADYSAPSSSSEGASHGSGPKKRHPQTQTGEKGANAPALPPPNTKVSETRKRSLIKAGLACGDDFDRFTHGDPDEKQHFYRADKTPSPAVR